MLIEALLRDPSRVVGDPAAKGRSRQALALLLIAALGAMIYGIVVGSFSGGDQYWAAPVKTGLGMLLTGLICLPSLYVFGALGGSKARVQDILLLVAGLAALVTILLLGFAPVAWVFSQSTQSVAAMGALHLLFWLTATLFGLRFLNHGFKQLQGSSNLGLKVWMLVYVVVGLQMTTALRPFVGVGATFLPVEKKFFLSHWADSLNGKPSIRP